MSGHKTTIDWLGFRAKSTPYQIVEALRPLFGSTGELLTFKPGLKGKDGWLYAGELLMAGDITLGRIDYGGDSQRGWARVNLTGEGCAWVQDWSAAMAMSRALTDAQIKRLDIALTTKLGEISDQTIVDAYQAGKFTAGGRPPEMRSITSSDPRAGKTRYIGSRKAHKLLRCYEKGFEQIKDVPHFKDQITHIEGFKVEEIYRVELELKDVDKIICWEAIEGRDSVFAGAYPFCEEIMPDVPVWRMLTLPNLKPEMTIARATENVRRSYGPTLRALLMAHGGDAQKVMALVAADQPSTALVAAGILTLAHV